MSAALVPYIFLHLLVTECLSILRGPSNSIESLQPGTSRINFESAYKGKHSSEDSDMIQNYVNGFDALKKTGKMPNPLPLSPGDQNVSYIHIPKTGTSFVDVLARTACPRLPISDDWAVSDAFFEDNPWLMTPKYCDHLLEFHGHRPLQVKEYGQAIGMIRKPSSRTVSAFHFYFPSGSEQFKKWFANSTLPIYDFATNHGCIGYQTRMLLGDHFVQKCCQPEWTYKCRDLQEMIHVGKLMADPDARPLIQKGHFRAAGITEEWTTSVLLFHAMYGGSPVKSNWKNCRFTGTSDKDKKYEGSFMELRDNSFKDPYDERLYEMVVATMKENAGTWFGPACEGRWDNQVCAHLKERGFLE